MEGTFVQDSRPKYRDIDRHTEKRNRQAENKHRLHVISTDRRIARHTAANVGLRRTGRPTDWQKRTDRQANVEINIKNRGRLVI